MDMNSIVKLNEALRTKNVSAVEITKDCLKKIESKYELNSMIYIAEESALTSAAAADKKIAAGEKLPLLGVPLIIKDNIAVSGMPLTCASKILQGFVPPYDAAVAKRLMEAGAIILGKSNMDEFAMGCGGETSIVGPTLNPADKTRTAGGSSGGSAAAVASGLCFGALGTDTGGSIRQPAAFCGAVGYKPTFGTVSSEGIVPVASSLEQAGPIAKTVEDLALILNTMSGIDMQNPQKIKLKGKKIGLIKEFQSVKTDDTVKASFSKAINFFESEGAELQEFSLPDFNSLLGAYMIISSAEAASNMAKFDGIKYGYRAKAQDIVSLYENTRTSFGDEVKKRVAFGNYILEKDNYEKFFVPAQKLRAALTMRMKEIFSCFNAIISPSTPSVAFKAGGCENSLEKKNSDIFLNLANLAGLPAITLPCRNDGLPTGLQIIGGAACDQKVLNIALSVEEGMTV